MEKIDGDGQGVEFKTNNIKWLGATTTMSAEQALQQALTDELTDVVIVGYDNTGTLCIRSSRLSRSEAMFLCEQGKNWALHGGRENESGT